MIQIKYQIRVKIIKNLNRMLYLWILRTLLKKDYNLFLIYIKL